MQGNVIGANSDQKNRTAWSLLREKRVPKWCPCGTIATNGTLFSNGNPQGYYITDSEIVLLGVLFRYPFFLSAM